MVFAFLRKKIPVLSVSFVILLALIVITSTFLQSQDFPSTATQTDNPDVPADTSLSSSSSSPSHAPLNNLLYQKDETSPTTYGSLTQTPLPESEDTSIISDDSGIEDRTTIYTSPSGEVTSIELTNVRAETTYIIDLSAYSCSEIAIAWPEGTIDYSFPTDAASLMVPLNPSDDIQSFEVDLTSPLLHCPDESSQILTLLPHTFMSFIRIDLFHADTHTAQIPSLQNSTLSSGIYNLDSGASYSSLPIITRDQWGAHTASWDPYRSTDIDDPSRFVWEPAYHRISRIIIHHTETTSNPSNTIAAIRQIYLYHTYTRGWGDIGYNYLIDQYGNIYEGKAGGDGVYGYHSFTEGNAMSIGIAMLGSFTNAEPTAAAQTALATLMAEKAAFYNFDLRYSHGSIAEWLDSSYTVFGHRDSWFWCYPEHAYFNYPLICNSQQRWAVNATGCPGNTFYPTLSSITARAQQIRNTTFTSLSQAASEVHTQMQYPHYSNVILVSFNLPENTPQSTIRSLIPMFSGISDVTIEGNTATIRVLDWNSGGSSVPPAGWDGYNAVGTFFPPSSGVDDQMETLIKYFSMNPQVRYAETIGERTLF